MNYAEIIKERVSCRELLESAGVKVDRRGFAICPFHAEKNPSLKVYEKLEDGWACFGCGRGGDVINLAMLLYKTDFVGSVERLNEQFSLNIPRIDQLTPKERKQMYLESERRKLDRARREERMKEREDQYWTAYDAWLENERVINEPPEDMSDATLVQIEDAIERREELQESLQIAEERRVSELPEEKPEERIRAFKEQDYYNEDGVPYKYLLSFSDNRYKYETLRVLMAQCAKKLGVTSFAKLLKAYSSSLTVEQTHGVENGRVTCDEQQIELRSGMYHCDDSGVRVDAPGYIGGEIVVCAHPIIPIKRMVNVDTGEVKIQLAYRRGTGFRWQYAIFDKQTLSTARSITALSTYGIDVTSESAKELVKYLAYIENENYDLIPEEKLVERLGWVDDEGFSPYAKDIVYDNGGQFLDIFKSIKSEGSYEEWLKLARTIRSDLMIQPRIVLAASFASVLLKKIDALPFLVHVWGAGSGTGKTVSLCLAASVWAYPATGNYIRSLKSTDVGLEQLAFFTGNMPLCLDELQLIQNRKNFDEMIYWLCQGTGKTRGAKTGGLQAVRRWCNTIITTGEQPITTSNSRAGAVNRTIEIECLDKLFPDPRAVYVTLAHNYGFAGKDFVEKLQNDPDAIKLLKETQARFQEELDGVATDKQVLAASMILTADFMADKYIFHSRNHS